MTGKTTTIDSADVDAMLGALLEAAGDLKPALKNIGEAGAQSTKNRFIIETDPQGRPWKDLNTLYAMTKQGPGKLKGATRSLSQIVWQLTDDGVEWGSNEVYARIHNEGGEIRPKNAAALAFSMGGQTFLVKKVTIPQRQFLGTNQADIDEMMDIVMDHFVYAAEAGNGTP